MHSGQAQFIEIAENCLTRNGSSFAGVRGCYSAAGSSRWSGSMLGGFCGPFVSNRPGLRQTEEATLRGTKIPCPQRPYSKRHLFFLNQSVAAEIERDPRQLKFVHGSPDCGGGANTIMTVVAHPASAAFFLNTPSDSRCRLDG